MHRVPNITPLRDADFGFGLLPWARGPLWRLEEDYTFKVAKAEFTIPAGYEFDKASVPPFFWGFPFNYTPDGLCTVPALEHDFLCDLLTGGSYWLREKLGTPLPKCPPAWVVHEHFTTRLFLWGVRWSKARAMGSAVKAFGPQGWATSPSNILKMISI